MAKMFHNKLIRDRIPEIMDAKGVKYELRTLEVTDNVRAMADKVVEEAQEVHGAMENRAELVKELADLREIMAALMNEKRISEEEVAAMQKKRHDERGGFDKKLFLTWTEE